MTLKFKNDSNLETQLIAPLLQKYSVSIPRYTSYPTAPEWNEHFSFSKNDFTSACEKANKSKTPVSLYFHLPFCENQCYFCACNVVISKKRDVTTPYLTHIKKEIENTSKLINKETLVEQIHLCGGTPTYFTGAELKDFFNFVKNNFNFSKKCEIGIEIDPRVTDAEHIKILSELGFNRLSMGIQDFNEKVQEIVNRVQSFELTNNLFHTARDSGFESINIDLMYGLPHQTEETFKRTIELILKLNPDRIALFHYAHLPQMINHQAKYIPENALPGSDTKIKIFLYAVQELGKNGYEFIGLDHFAKPKDELAIARKNKTLHRNFQGYTTKAGCDLYGFGITAISNIQDTYSQNLKKLNDYYSQIDLNEIPIFKGMTLSKDDILRKEIIMKILCHGEIVKSEIEEKYSINFDRYFSFETEKLKEFEKDGVLINHVLEGHGKPCPYSSGIQVTTLGQFFLRNIASVFDSYLQKKNAKQKIYSKSI